MRRALDTLACATILGVAAASPIAALAALAERYPQQGLHHLTLELWADALSAYLAVSLAGGCASLLLGSAAPWLYRRSRSLAAKLVELGAWLLAWLPVVIWVGVRDHWLLPEDSVVGCAASALLVLLLAGLFYTLRRLSRRRDRQGSGRALHAIGSLCLLVAGAILGISRAGMSAPGGVAAHPNILLIVLDTVRADRLSAYGYARPTTPELAAFAEKAIRYTDFYATAPWTVPSHASLFTGLYPVSHHATQERVKLEASFATLAEILRNAGYQTWGASGNPWMGPAVNLSQGFETFVETWRADLKTGLPRPSGTPHPANAAFTRFLERRDPRRPFFAFINYMDAHMPFVPPEPYASRFLPPDADRARAFELGQTKWSEYYRGRPYTDQDLLLLSNLYDAGLAYLSSEVGALLRIAERRGHFEDTLIVITADHGEHFGENGLIGHMFGLYNTAVRAPLLIRTPGGERAGELDHRKGQLVDLFPTILNVAGVDFSRFRRRGVDLLSLKGEARRESIFSEYYYPAQVLWQFTPEEIQRRQGFLKPYLRRLRAVERYGFRFIWSSNGRHELYDLKADPGENHNLYDAEHRTAAADEFLELLVQELESYVPGLSSKIRMVPESALGQAPAEVDEETLKALRAVGYVR